MALSTATPYQDGNAAPHVGSLHDAALISGRIERLPFTRWHARVLSVVSFVHMTDAFDALTIAFVLPVLMGVWHLTPGNAGLLIAAGYVGQTIGSLTFSSAAERYGRLRVLAWVVAILALGSLASAFAPSYAVFVALRFVQGIGLGGESPVSATYMNELCPSKIRGRVIFVLQSTFALGNLLVAVAATWLIPRYGWQVMYFVGTLPILLAVLLPRIAPESPRWLAIQGKSQQAGEIVDQIEQSLSPERRAALPPAVALEKAVVVNKEPFSALFRRGVTGRTLVVWVLASCASLLNYGILVWLPSLYRTVYHLPLEISLRYGVYSMIATLIGTWVGIFIIDWLGRKKSFVISFVGAALPLLYLTFSGLTVPAEQVALLTSVSVILVAIVQCGIYVYAPEVYPTRIRARGAGAASAVTRIASVVGPLIIGALLTHLTIHAVFAYFSIVAVIGAIIIGAFAIETRGRTLEEIGSSVPTAPAAHPI